MGYTLFIMFLIAPTITFYILLYLDFDEGLEKTQILNLMSFLPQFWQVSFCASTFPIRLCSLFSLELTLYGVVDC